MKTLRNIMLMLLILFSSTFATQMNVVGEVFSATW